MLCFKKSSVIDADYTEAAGALQEPTGLVVRHVALTPPAAATKAMVKAETMPSATEQEIIVAQQKAHFVGSVWELAKAKKIPLQAACGLAAGRAQDDFPDLLTAGHNGKSAVGEKSAWPNYRQWARKLGLVLGSRKPDVTHWEALLPQHRGSREYRRPGAEEFWPILARFYEHPNQLSLRYAYELATIAFSKSVRPDAPNVLPVPSYAQVHHYYEKHADQKAVMIARHGEEWYRNNVAGYIQRAAPMVDECWVGDHHIFDAAVKVWDPAASHWVPVRPWLTAWLDWGSLAFVGWQIRAISPNRDSIERALRHGLQCNGRRPPRHLYVDNGKDYKSAMGKAHAGPARSTSSGLALSDDDQQRVRSICALLGIQPHFAIPFNARAKLVERIFGIVCGHFSKLWKSYRGSSPEHRPETADAAWADVENLPTVEQFAAAFEQWLAAMYHVTPGGGNILAGKSPAEARAAARPLREPVDDLLIYKAFLRELPGERTIQRGGMVRALNRWYRSEALWKLLGSRETVRVKVDTDNLATAWIFSADGRELGPAQEVSRLPALIAGTNNATPETIEALREQLKLQRRQVNEAKAASAANRGLGRYTVRALPNAAGGVFNLSDQPIDTAQGRLSAISGQPVPGKADVPSLPPSVDPGLVAELDAALREQTAERLGREPESMALDAGDAAILAEIESAV